MVPENFDELLVLFDEALSELQLLREERIDSAHWRQLDALIVAINDAIDTYDEQTTVDEAD